MKEMPVDLQLRIMSNTDPESFSYMMATCKTFFIFYLPISRIIKGFASHDQAINIKTLHHLINNMAIYRGYFPKISSLLDAFSKRQASTNNLNIVILLDMLRFLFHLDMQPEIAHLDFMKIANNVFHKLYNGLLLDFIIQKCKSLKNMPNNLSTIISDIQSNILTVDSCNDNAGFCNEDSIIFYAALYYLDIDTISKHHLMTKALKWLSIQARSTDFDLHAFEVMAANMRCLGYEFDGESRVKFSSEIVRNSIHLSNENFGPRDCSICLEDEIAYSIIRINSIESFTVEINTKRITVCPFSFLENLLEKLCLSYVSYLLIHSGKYFIDHLFDYSMSCVNTARFLLSVVNKLSNKHEVKATLVNYLNSIHLKDSDIDKYLALYILKFNFGVDNDYSQLSTRIKEMIINKIKIGSLETKWILKDVFSEAQLLEIECFGLECYVKCADNIRYGDFLSYLITNSVSEKNKETARQIIEANKLQKLPCYPNSLYGIYDYFRYLQPQDEAAIQSYIDHVVTQVKPFLNPKYKSEKNINDPDLINVYWRLKYHGRHHLIKTEYHAAYIDTINHIFSLEELVEPNEAAKLSQIYCIVEKFIEYFNEGKEIIITRFFSEISTLIFNFNLSDQPLYSYRIYPDNIIRLQFCNFTQSTNRVIEECWLPFMIGYHPGQLGKVITQISANIVYISDEIFRKQLIQPLFMILDFKFESDDYIANNTYEHQIDDLYKCLSHKSHLLTYEEICVAGSRPSRYQHYFTFIRSSMEICNNINVICER